MPYRDYLRLEGWCSIVLGLEMALVAFPGLFVSWTGWPLALLFVPGVLLLLGGFGVLRNGARPGRPGEWLTTRPLRGAENGRPGLSAAALRRRLLVETAMWIVGVTALVLIFGSSPLLIFGTGLASAAFGAVQAFPARARVEAEERRRGLRFVVAERPGLGTPSLGTA